MAVCQTAIDEFRSQHPTKYGIGDNKHYICQQPDCVRQNVVSGGGYTIALHLCRHHHLQLGATTSTYGTNFDKAKAIAEAQRLATINENNPGKILKSNNYMLYAGERIIIQNNCN